MSEICLSDVDLFALLVALVAVSFLAGIHNVRGTQPERLLFIDSRWARFKRRYGLRWWT